MYLTDQAAAVVAASLSKSEKIRRLKRQGMRQADIARALGIRDQFVSNVVRREASDSPAPARRDELDNPATEPLQPWPHIAAAPQAANPPLRIAPPATAT